MNQTQAARVLVALARTEPDYDALSAAYGAAAECVRAPLPPDFPEQVLNLFRDNPATAERVERYEENLSRMESYGVEDILSPELIVTVLVLLSVHFNVKWDKKSKWTFEAGYKPLNAKALQSVLSVLGAAIDAAGKELAKLSETPDGQADAEQDT